MPRRSVSLRATDSTVLVDGVRAIEAEMKVPANFPPEVEAAAAAAAEHPRLPDLDRTDLPLVTIDPPGARDLDQALHIERRGSGFRIWYAIADVGAFVDPDGPIDRESHVRGETLYAPDHRTLLYPAVLSEGAASLLPDGDRPALLWTIDVDSLGEGVKVDVARARVRSRARLDYETVQRWLDEGSADDSLRLLEQVGRLRVQREAERGGVDLRLPDQEVVVEDDQWSLRFHRLLPVETWNAQVSLLTGMGCAEIMLYGEVGLVRTLPEPTHAEVARLRRTAAALHLHWQAELNYPEFVRSIDPNTPEGAAMLEACARLLRGASYVAFDGGVPEHIEHAALASEYAHTTAPLRRLADRYAGEIAVALCAGAQVPDWVRARLRDLPREMNAAQQRSHQFEAAVLSLVEAGLLVNRVGDTFDAVVTEVDEQRADHGLVMLHDPAVEAAVTSADGSAVPLGERVAVRLIEADPAGRRVHFELAGS